MQVPRREVINLSCSKIMGEQKYICMGDTGQGIQRTFKASRLNIDDVDNSILNFYADFETPVNCRSEQDTLICER